MFACTPDEDDMGVGVVRSERGKRCFVVWLKPRTKVVAGWYNQEDLFIINKP
jgi:hypothetical protein